MHSLVESLSPKQADTDIRAPRVILVQGADPVYLPLAERIAVILQPLLIEFDYLSDGQGNCGLISAIAHAVATNAGYNARLLGGNCLDANGQAPFGRRGGHFWVELADGTVIDGAGTNRVQVYRPEAVGYRMIPIIGRRREAACMRKAKTWLDLSGTIQQGIAKNGLGFLSLLAEVA